MKFLVLLQVKMNFNSLVLYDYTNREQDLVQACFRVGNFVSLRDMPEEFRPNNVIQAMRERAEKA
jgi:hypothetical protein